MEYSYKHQAEPQLKKHSFEQFYCDQAGNGIDDFYSSYRYLPNQRGNGFFGRLIKSSLLPLLKSIMPYIKDTAVEGVGNLIENVKSGENIKQAAKNALKNTASNVLTDMAAKVKKQKGSGLRKSKRKRQQRGYKTRRKTTKKSRTRVRKRNSKKCVLFT